MGTVSSYFYPNQEVKFIESRVLVPNFEDVGKNIEVGIIDNKNISNTLGHQAITFGDGVFYSLISFEKSIESLMYYFEGGVSMRFYWRNERCIHFEIKTPKKRYPFTSYTELNKYTVINRNSHELDSIKEFVNKYIGNNTWP